MGMRGVRVWVVVVVVVVVWVGVVVFVRVCSVFLSACVEV